MSLNTKENEAKVERTLDEITPISYIKLLKSLESQESNDWEKMGKLLNILDLHNKNQSRKNNLPNLEKKVEFFGSDYFDNAMINEFRKNSKTSKIEQILKILRHSRVPIAFFHKYCYNYQMLEALDVIEEACKLQFFLLLLHSLCHQKDVYLSGF